MQSVDWQCLQCVLGLVVLILAWGLWLGWSKRREAEDRTLIQDFKAHLARDGFTRYFGTNLVSFAAFNPTARKIALGVIINDRFKHHRDIHVEHVIGYDNVTSVHWDYVWDPRWAAPTVNWIDIYINMPDYPLHKIHYGVEWPEAENDQATMQALLSQ